VLSKSVVNIVIILSGSKKRRISSFKQPNRINKIIYKLMERKKLKGMGIYMFVWICGILGKLLHFFNECLFVQSIFLFVHVATATFMYVFHCTLV
jgi:hypothetical protein